jgi:hypothetical protein
VSNSNRPGNSPNRHCHHNNGPNTDEGEGAALQAKLNEPQKQPKELKKTGDAACGEMRKVIENGSTGLRKSLVVIQIGSRSRVVDVEKAPCDDAPEKVLCNLHNNSVGNGRWDDLEHKRGNRNCPFHYDFSDKRDGREGRNGL